MATNYVVPEELREARQYMFERDLAGRDINDASVLAAMTRVPREEFVPPSCRRFAYDDNPLRIGCGQTISQPYVVAFMTQHLDVKPGMKVLEIGTGSGYQTAVLAEMGANVFTMERHEDLSDAAEVVLDRLGYGECVTMRVDDGTLGWPEDAPYDRIIVTAAGPSIPAAYAEQLAEGGILLMPVGGERGEQRLVRAEKREGILVEQAILDVTFVPLIGENGFGTTKK
jgi:protein-L-isoaspartate(D-aspartate) O-methyltransferase